MNLTQKPRFQGFHIEGIQHISPEDAFEAMKSGKAFMLDVREPNEVKLEMVDMPDVLYFPMSLIMKRLQNIPTDKLLITACPGGVRSSKVANLLIQQGIKNVANLDGGLTLWKAKSFPFESIISVGCGCNTENTKNETEPIQNNCSCDSDCKTGCC